MNSSRAISLYVKPRAIEPEHLTLARRELVELRVEGRCLLGSGQRREGIEHEPGESR